MVYLCMLIIKYYYYKIFNVANVYDSITFFFRVSVIVVFNI